MKIKIINKEPEYSIFISYKNKKLTMPNKFHCNEYYSSLSELYELLNNIT